MLGTIKRLARKTVYPILYPVPAHLFKNHAQVDDAGMRRIEESLSANYHQGWRSASKYTSEAYDIDREAHLRVRLECDRRRVIPWLDHTRSLKGLRVLEIGCGTGSSTVALAEQGAEVTGIDIDEGALAVARDRCRAFGVTANIQTMNAGNLRASFKTGDFDMIVFFASLEHMTVPERLVALKDTWALLADRGLLVVVETPNRLSYFDEHTAQMPFFHWLPDGLAYQYSRFSPRMNFNDLYHDEAGKEMEQFLRHGRGVSFHEFEVSIRPVKDITVASSMYSFEGWRCRQQRSRREKLYKALMRSLYPHLHQGWFDNSLYIALLKT